MEWTTSNVMKGGGGRGRGRGSEEMMYKRRKEEKLSSINYLRGENKAFSHTQKINNDNDNNNNK